MKKFRITGGNGEEIEREVRSEGETIERIGGGTNGVGVWAECLVEQFSDVSNLRHVNQPHPLLSQFSNPSFSHTHSSHVLAGRELNSALLCFLLSRDFFFWGKKKKYSSTLKSKVKKDLN